MRSTPVALSAPRWPSESIESNVAWVDYYAPADEFLVYFSGKPVPAISDPINAPGFRGLAVMFGLDENHEPTEEIVGVQVIPMLLGAVPDQPHWAALAWAAMAGDYGTELLKERLPSFLDEVARAFREHWTSPPPVEEQLSAIASRRKP